MQIKKNMTNLKDLTNEHFWIFIKPFWRHPERVYLWLYTTCIYIPFCSLSTPEANRSGSPRLISLIWVPRHSIWRTLHHSSASSSAYKWPKICRLACSIYNIYSYHNCAHTHTLVYAIRPTWFTSKSPGCVIIKIYPYSMFPCAFWQPQYILHMIKFCNLELKMKTKKHSHSWISLRLFYNEYSR